MELRDDKLLSWWRAVSSASAWLARVALVVFALGLLLIGVATLSTALFGVPPKWLPNARLADPNLVGSLGTLLLGLAGLYIGSRLRKYQEIEAEARANLALNVDLRTQVVEAGQNRILEVIVDVHNVSRTTWFVPMAYVFVRSALDGRNIPLDQAYCNVARFTATLCQLQPDERDQFFATIVFDYAESQALAAVVVSAEVMGASAKWLGPWRRMMAFVDFLDADNGARHKYLCVSRCATRNHKWYGRRCFFESDGSIDEEATSSYRGFLDDMMLWNRERVVSLAELRPERPSSASIRKMVRNSQEAAIT
jgi:hypothetical protein